MSHRRPIYLVLEDDQSAMLFLKIHPLMVDARTSSLSSAGHILHVRCLILAPIGWTDVQLRY